MVCAAVDPALNFQPLVQDGTRVKRGDRVAAVRGPMRSLLTAERTALNFLQRLSGVATLTRRYVDAIAGLPCQILDTRKTTPGWRLLEKYAVYRGGGHNHRLGLYDGVLIKDNHLAALTGEGSPITRAVKAAREKLGESVPIEVEVDSLDQLEKAAEAGADLILLDNMSLDQLAAAVRWRKQKWLLFGGVQLEASGGVTLDTVRAIAETGVDRISVGALTHSAPALDIALDYETP
jgi:nicotinate-nucleotide pyrophosphorylase (carboxylating)